MGHLMREFSRHLDDDLSRLMKEGELLSYVRASRDHFVKYLVSVVTHPIGLRASVSPFNSTQEHMLAYIINIFNISDRRVKKLFGETRHRDKSTDIDAATDNETSVKKRHSWRPELRFRLNAPKFFYNEQEYLSNLSVRVYLFREKSLTIQSENARLRINQKSNGGILRGIFKKPLLESSKLIRPANEMRRLIKFEPDKSFERASKTETTKLLDYKMVQIVEGDEYILDDVNLNIRRYYCNPEDAHILRLEFWLEIPDKTKGLIERYQNFLRRLVFNRCRTGCCCQQRKSIYMNEKQEFYGYVNLRLSQIPAYPIKQNQPILSVHGRKLNNCEINIELRNRRILGSANGDVVLGEEKTEQNRKSAEFFVINHLRLYANCLLSQCLASNQVDIRPDVMDHDYISNQNVTIDNLLYLPAYTLINQHRLQGNINLLEDKCTRRVSILISLIKLDKKTSPRIDQVETSLLSIIQNEYMIAQSSVDDKTMQEINPFKDSVRESLVRSEFESLRIYADQVLSKRVQNWLVCPDDIHPRNKVKRYITLLSLRLFKTALSYFESSLFMSLKLDFQDDVTMLRGSIEQLLCSTIITRLANHITQLTDEDQEQTLEHAVVIRKSRYRVLYSQGDEYPWLHLLKEINQINHDLKLYWMREGFDGLIRSQLNFVGKLSMFTQISRGNLGKIIYSKIDDYLKK